MATEATLYMFPYGFIENTYNLYCRDHFKKKKGDSQLYPSRFGMVQFHCNKSRANNISLEKQLLLDAEFMLAEELAKQPEKLQAMINQIKNDPKWFKIIQDKAAQKQHTG